MQCYYYAMDLCYMSELSDVFYPFPIRVRFVSEPYPISEIIRIRIRICALSDPFSYPKNENGYGYGMSTIQTISDPVSPLCRTRWQGHHVRESLIQVQRQV